MALTATSLGHCVFVSLILLGATGFAACSSDSTVDSGACGKSLDNYHLAQVESDASGGLSDADEGKYQNAIVQQCDEPSFEALLKGPNYDYTKGPDGVAYGNPQAVWDAYCDGASKPNHC